MAPAAIVAAQGAPCLARQQQRRSRAQLAVPEQRERPAAAAPWVGLAAAGALLLAAPEAHALDTAATFARSCAGCHAGGGNVIRRDATLQLADLQKYGLDSEDGVYNIIYSGRNSMPGFGKECAPRGACTFGPRLADEDIRELATYVLANARQGWAAAEAPQ